MESEVKNIIKTWLSVISSLCYCYFISSKIPKGYYRLLSLSPIFYLFTILPYSLSSAFAVGHTTFLFTWLANFKLLLFSFDMGPISMDPPKSLPIFITIATLPIDIKHHHRITPKPKKIPLNLPTEIFLVSILLSQLGDHRESRNPIILLLLYCLVVFLIVDISIGIWVEIIRSVSGLQLLPPSDEPYLSTSLQDFWGRRWNLAVTNILRDTIHNPVKSVVRPAFGNEGAKVAAVLATFMVSGLMHELFLYNLAHASPTWEMTWYFVLQGLGLVAELWAKKVVGVRWALSGFVSTPLTVGFVVVTGYWFFFPALVKNGVDAMVFEEFRYVMEFAKNKGLSVFNHAWNLCNGP
ncbi:hypothetical protein LguiA_023358 [Lonicera macranthoides]